MRKNANVVKKPLFKRNKDPILSTKSKIYARITNFGNSWRVDTLTINGGGGFLGGGGLRFEALLPLEVVAGSGLAAFVLLDDEACFLPVSFFFSPFLSAISERSYHCSAKMVSCFDESSLASGDFTVLLSPLEDVAKCVSVYACCYLKLFQALHKLKF